MTYYSVGVRGSAKTQMSQWTCDKEQSTGRTESDKYHDGEE